MDWQGACLRLLKRPKVLHRLPGRLRINVPYLKHLPRERQDLAQLIASLLTVPRAVRRAEPNLASGNVLIHYDAGNATEEEVLGLIQGLFNIYIRHRERFARLEAADVPALVERLKPVVDGAVRQQLNVDTNIEIPNHVLD